MLSADSGGNPSALPAGSPSGGVRVGGEASTEETDVQLGGEGEEGFFFHLQIISAEIFLWENVGQRREDGLQLTNNNN